MVKYIEPRVLGAESRLAAEAGYLVVYRLARENLVASVQAATVYMYIIRALEGVKSDTRYCLF